MAALLPSLARVLDLSLAQPIRDSLVSPAPRVESQTAKAPWGSPCSPEALQSTSSPRMQRHPFAGSWHSLPRIHSNPPPPAASAGKSREAAAAASSRVKAPVEEDVVVSFPETPLFVPYPGGPQPQVFLSQHGTGAELGRALAEFVVEASREAIRARGLFVVALSGGSLVEALGSLATEPYSSQVEWSKWHVLWVDERFVPHTSDDSNFKQAASKLLARVPMPEDQILPTDDEFTTLEEIAEDYEALLRELVEDDILTTTKGKVFPRFDLILLGIGPEGHTASLFPNSPALAETSHWVLPIAQSPKPPPQRITMTLPVINSARKVAFVASGSSKAEVVQRVLERTALPGSLPAQLVRPYSGSVTWFLDDAAASGLSFSDWGNLKKFPYVQGK